MKNKIIYNNLEHLFSTAPTFNITNKDKIVIFSDLHIGRKDAHDDFIKNGKIFKYILKNYYLKKKFKLILNGDVEETHRFSLQKIMNKWQDLYTLFTQFKKKNHLIKLVGNHDYRLYIQKDQFKNITLHEAIKLNYYDNIIFVFHGHQASYITTRFNNFFGFILHYLATPLYIKNKAIPLSSKKQFKIERTVYNYSITKKIMSIIGHTHRPLFESLSKIDFLKFKIEQLCRQYPYVDKKMQTVIKNSVKNYKKELLFYYNKKQKRETQQKSLYNTKLHIPTLFNSGCVIGKSGITAIEIDRGQISLVHWFDRNKNQKYLKYHHPKPTALPRSPYYRIVLNSDQLTYIFTRINLLT